MNADPPYAVIASWSGHPPNWFLLHLTGGAPAVGNKEGVLMHLRMWLDRMLKS